tara:strand:+ start:1858 stop:2505 length:648 start_codon:yes stop_codon:yes gene_type:complete
LGAATSSVTQRDRFCRRYSPLIETYLASRWRLPRGHERVADGTQDVFLQLFKPNGALKGVDPSRPGGFRAYLYGVTTKVASERDRVAARQQRERGDPRMELDQLGSSWASQSQAFDQAWARLVFQEAYETMVAQFEGDPTALRSLQVLQLRYDEALPPREIAKRLVIADVRVVYQVLDTGKAKFRRALLSVMAEYNPSCSKNEVENLCRQLLSLF